LWLEYKDTRDHIGIQITTTKLNGKSFLLWEKTVRVYLGARGKFKMVTCCKPSSSNAKSPETVVEEYERVNFMVMTCLWNSME